METVAFYSYTGGVGRSRLLVDTARSKAHMGRRVIMLDLAIEAPVLHYKANVAESVKAGVVGLLQRSLDGDLPTLDEVRAATVAVPVPTPQGGWLRLLASGPAPRSEYWAELGRLHARLARSQGAGLLEAVLDLRARIEEVWDPDVLLVDTRSGVTELGGIATMALCDSVVLVTTRSAESVDGILAVADSLRATPTLRGGERRLEFRLARGWAVKAIAERDLREMKT
jgi:MinD-like ATPase involved in chromosome partitioning or flagellar assembly